MSKLIWIIFLVMPFRLISITVYRTAALVMESIRAMLILCIALFVFVYFLWLQRKRGCSTTFRFGRVIGYG
jgi:ABC-type nickel/cobalt efflux system permease component RcnA